MGKLSDFFKKQYDKWKNLKSGVKIALGVSFIGVLIVAIYLTVSLGSTKYSVLFANLESDQAKAVMDQLKQQKITDYKISGNSILVPSTQVDSLRLQLAPQIDSTSSGWALFDTGNTFSSTDAELKIKYQRALQAELEKTIKSFPQIDKTRVTLVLPEDSVFVKDSTPASASVTLIMKSGQTLNDDQVRAIVALITGSVKNLPKENVQVVDDKMKLLTKDLFDEDKMAINSATEKQQQYKSNLEKQLETKAMDQLSKPYKNKVTVKVNADVDFDAVQSTTNTVDPKGTVVSEKYTRDTNGTTTTRPSQSPVDNNMTNGTTTTTTNTNGNVTHEEETKNYEISKSETKTVKAPGAVKRLTASVIIDGTLDSTQQQQIKDLVSNAIGYDQNRGDTITVEGMKFDTTDLQAAQKTIDELKQADAQQQKMTLYKELIAGGAGLIVLIIFIIIMARRRKKSLPQEEQLEAIVPPKGIDVLIGNEEPKVQVQFKPIDFDNESNNERTHIEKEIKKYAAEKPEQVADIIKSWLAEDER